MKTVLVWLRRDLRLHDHPALHAALRQAERVIPVFILDPALLPGAAARWWLHHALAALQKEMRKLGGDLVLRQGTGGEVLPALYAKFHAEAVFWNRSADPGETARDERVAAALRAQGIRVEAWEGDWLWPPGTLTTNQGRPYQVFTPFWKKCWQRGGIPPPAPTPSALPPVPEGESVPLESFALLPKIPWDQGFHEHWQPGEAAGLARLEAFCGEGLFHYAEQRDFPNQAGTSRCSPYLHHGDLGPRQVWFRVHQAIAEHPAGQTDAEAFLRQLGWRDFALHLLHHFPATVTEPLNPRFAAFPWRTDFQTDLQRWQQGRTGIPIVDAGMRELWHTGWMHNRVRMLCASWLTKNLRIPWQVGADWFADTLVDMDLANNTMGWQWVAGCGADAAPYFRIFNPVTQGEKFDGKGAYVRRWVPELAALPDKFLHQPWRASPPPAGYPPPQVDPGESRQQALAAYRNLTPR